MSAPIPAGLENSTFQNLEEGRGSQVATQAGHTWTVLPASHQGATTTKVTTCSLGALFLGIGVAGTVVYCVTTGDAKTAGLVAMCVGYVLCCCGGVAYQQVSVNQ